MKKLTMLTSCLALTACFGGGGNGVTGGTSDISRVTTLGPGAISSNSAVTGMKSEIVVANDGSGSLARSATRNYNGKAYTVYTLDDIDLKLADNSGGDIYFNFKLDENGRIDQGSLITGVNPADATELLKIDLLRDGETTQFHGAVLEYVYNNKTYIRIADNGTIGYSDLVAMVTNADTSKIPADAKANGRWDRMDQVWEMETTGNTAGLQYSDFGYLKTANLVKDKAIADQADLAAARAGTRTGSNHAEYANLPNDNEDSVYAQLHSGDNFMFAGGYEINSTPTDSMTFTGTAHGKVYTSVTANSHKDDYKALYSMTSGDNAMAFDTTHAVLTFTPGSTPTEELYMPFGTDGANFYDVTVTKTGETETFAFNKPDGVTIARKFEQDTNSNKPANATVGTAVSNVNIGYHGINTPAEATGTAAFSQVTTLNPLNEGDVASREFNFEAAFGGKKN